MSFYLIVLFLHVLGALGMFAALGIEWAVAEPLRRATDLAQARPWIGALRSTRRLAGPSAVMILVSGVYMGMAGSGHQPWIGIGFLGLVLLAILGGGITGRRIAAIIRDLSGSSPKSTSALVRFQDPLLVFSLRLRTAIATGVVFLMTIKPTAGLAVAVMVIAVALGVAWSAPVLTRRRSAAVEQVP